MKYLITLLFCVNVAFAQCPNGTYVDILINTDQYPGETSWVLLKSDGDTVVTGGPYNNIIDYFPQNTQLCLPNGDYWFDIYDSYGDGLAGSLWGGQDGSYFVMHCGDTLVQPDSANFGNYTYHGFTINDCAPPPPIYGCMDESFVEFLPIATLDTGMCYTPRLYGCTDEEAFNYDSIANTNVLVDSCSYTLELTDLAGNGWAGAYLQVFQGINFLGIFTLEDGFDTTFTFDLSISEPVGIKFNTTQQSQFTSVQCGYSLYSEEHLTISEPGGFANPLVPFAINLGMPYCGNSCIEKVYGCIDDTALNYNDEANTDDESCYYVEGCTNPIYIEYNADADFDDGTCETLIVLGCMDSTALNYNPEANQELEGSCIDVVLGCMNELAFNYNPNANVADTCIAVVEGCMVEGALNYDSLANVDDGSCIVPVLGCTDPDAFNFNVLANVDDGTCIAYSYGCTDPTAFNYDADANTDNGSCIEVINGCIDSTAINYNIIANTDNGSCIYPLPGCTDPTALNYNAEANVPDSSCYYSAGCDVGDIYTLPNECFSWVIEVDPYCCDNNWDNACDDLYVYCEEGWSGPVSITELRNNLVIYPNPTSDYININKKVDARVFNSLGKLVVSKNQTNVLDVSTLNKGVYYVTFEYNKLKINKKIIKQ